jgi:uncharacterized protein (TIGR00645 family)
MNHITKSLPKFVFWTRWLQAPLYIGLIVVLIVYVFEFGLGLIHLVKNANKVDDTLIMLQALDLIDVVMIANLLIMVIIGGYETFVSRLNMQNHPDQPEWLDEVNAGTMKVKLALALITISSIHLLRTFIDTHQNHDVVMWQVIIHLTLVVSAVAIAITNKIMVSAKNSHPGIHR